MADERPIEIPTLGRPMQLGMLYDCRSDTLIPGITLWDPDVLKRHRDVHSKHETQFDIISSDSLETKSNVLNVEASIKASFLCGLVEVKGSGKYLLDRKTSSRQSRLSLQYRTTRKFEQLTMKQLGRGNVQHPHVFEQGTATHVVTGILYGAQAFFVFDRNISKDEKMEDIQGNLKVLIEKIPLFSVQGEGNMHLDERERKEVDMMQCKFYGDFAIEKNPTNYTDAVKVYGHLPSLLGKDGEHAVPMSVWLYPLSKLDSKAAQLVREISVNLISQTEGILEGLNQCQIRSEDLKSNPLCKDFPQFSEKLNVFKKLIIEYRLILQQKLAKLLPEVRGGGSEETVLANVLSEHAQSPFCLHKLDLWLKLKEKEMNVVKAYLKVFPDVAVIGARETLDELILNPIIGNLVCFSFPLIGKEDIYMGQMSHYTRTSSGSSQDVSKGWFDDVSSSKKMRARAKQFMNFVNANAQASSLTFAVIGFDDGEQRSTEGGTLFLYEQGILTNKDYEPPGIPGTPVVLESLHDSASLEWVSPVEGTSGIEAYLINYRETQRGGNGWTEFRSETTEPEAIISGLKPNVSYQFRVAAVSSIGVSKFSETSPGYTTLPASPPLRLKQYQTSTSSVTVEWDQPESVGENTEVERYRIKCNSLKYSDQTETFTKDTEEPNCLMTISDLESCVSYRIKVSALCGSGGLGAFSEEIIITTSSENHVAKHLTTPENLLKIGDASQGEPSIYRLPLSADLSMSEDKYRVYHFGNPENVGKQHRVVMLVGATGAGKSTLINSMINYIFRVDWGDAFRFKIITGEGENESSSQAESKTQYVTSYTIFQSEHLQVRHTLTIIDTPGFGNTKGVDEDHSILEQIRDFISNSQHAIDYINAIGFVAQASQTRLTQFQRYVFEMVLSLFGRNVEENLLFLLTFADDQNPQFMEVTEAAKIPCSDNIFKFNNSALFANTIDLTEESATQGDFKSEKQEETFHKMLWRMNIQSMGKFFSVLDKAKPKSLSLTREVLHERKRLEVALEGLKPQIRLGCCKLEELRREQQILEQHERETEAKKDFIYEIELPKCRQIDITGEFLTNCAKCHFTCHYPCSIMDDREKKNCSAMDTSTGKCIVCPGKCMWNVHFNQRYKFEYYTVKEKRTYSELEKRYNEGTGRKLAVEQVIQRHLEEFFNVQQCVSLLISESHNCIQRLEEIALKPNPIPVVEYVDLLIQSESREANPGWKERVQALEDIRKDADILEKMRQSNYNPFEKYMDHFKGKGKKGKSIWGKLGFWKK